MAGCGKINGVWLMWWANASEIVEQSVVLSALEWSE